MFKFINEKDNNFYNLFKDLIISKQYNYNFLPTQNALKQHLTYLLKENIVDYVVVIWGLSEWKRLLGGNLDDYEKNKKLISINKYFSLVKKLNKVLGDEEDKPVDLLDDEKREIKKIRDQIYEILR